MRLSCIAGLCFVSSSGFVACSDTKSGIPGPASNGTTVSDSGGSSNSKGSSTKGGSTGSSNSDSKDGGSSSTEEAGGSDASGGAESSGGNEAQVGSSSAGGSKSSGGKTAAGGKSSGAGGVTTNGGKTSSTTGITTGAGSTTATTGGKTAAGGTMAAGGSSAGKSCTDTPRSTESCADAKDWGFCKESWFSSYCQATCGTCTSTASGGATSNSSTSTTSSNTGGSANPTTTNPPITGEPGWASRYWDCCMPSCSWTTNLPWCDKNGTTKHTGSNGAKSGCESGGNAFECYNFAPWYDAATNLSYGFVAHNQVPCGTCYQVQFTGEGHDGPNPGVQAVKGKQMIVQVINIGGIGSDQFDFLIPGGGVGLMTAGCTAQWGNVDLGATYGGLYANSGGSCSTMKTKCQSVFSSMPDALAGCLWFTDWFACADNPKLVYKKVSCPSQLTSKSGISA